MTGSRREALAKRYSKRQSRWMRGRVSQPSEGAWPRPRAGHSHRPCRSSAAGQVQILMLRGGAGRTGLCSLRRHCPASAPHSVGNSGTGRQRASHRQWIAAVWPRFLNFRRCGAGWRGWGGRPRRGAGHRSSRTRSARRATGHKSRAGARPPRRSALPATECSAFRHRMLCSHALQPEPAGRRPDLPRGRSTQPRAFRSCTSPMSRITARDSRGSTGTGAPSRTEAATPA